MQLRSPNIYRTSGLLLQLLFASLLVLAVSGITHFTNVIVYNINGLANAYILALLSAFGKGLIVVIAVNTISVLLKKIQYPFWKYLLLNVFIFILNFGLNYCLNKLITMWSIKYPDQDISPDWLFLVYIVHPMIVGSFLLFYLNRDQSRTRKISEQEYQLLQLKELKTKAELEALQAKISPHFLYNSLNSIASLVHIDPDKAEQMVMLLSKFFRYSTSIKSQYFHTVREEIEMITTYLDVEKVRFDERLHYEIRYTEMALEDCLIPRFLLQPLVENAVKHGISKIAENGEVIIEIAREKEYLLITVHDNGPAFPKQFTTSYGLQSISDKLKMLCGEGASIEIISYPLKQVKITTKLLKDLQSTQILQTSI